MSHRAFIGLGSNIEPELHLPHAVTELAQLGEVVAVSHVYESPAVGDVNQPNFLNAAVLLETEHSPTELCGVLREIEQRMGRLRDPLNVNAARTIDLDLVLYDDLTTTVGSRRIPDPDILTRSFLAVPLSEVDRTYVHPETGETLEVIAARLRTTGTELTERSDLDLRSL
ncbi:MAG: 2-amino-4-hydroxy-6-hydroxymethyldihydropteridine diphosphokinase [Planctomycetaceae bacterium]|nr:2-amino-4-hydroxy-6-hydroxymethyldihydropteridine diphosphokinase [Planctomycetaceae bacterium]